MQILIQQDVLFLAAFFSSTIRSLFNLGTLYLNIISGRILKTEFAMAAGSIKRIAILCGKKKTGTKPRMKFHKWT